jgi:hypothetical protein
MSANLNRFPRVGLDMDVDVNVDVLVLDTFSRAS